MPLTRVSPADITAFLDRTVAWASERRERLRTVGLVGALIVFAVGLVLAIRATPSLGSELKIAPLALLFVISAPLGTALSAFELCVLSRIGSGSMGGREAVELTVFTSAANMMPLPGGAITKLAGMKAHGVGYGAASILILLSFLGWAGVTFLFSGLVLSGLGHPMVAIAFAALGVALLIGCWRGFARFQNWKLVGQIVLVRIFYFATEATRYWAAFTALGIQIAWAQCATFGVASVVGAAVIIAPQGLGINEAAAALLATLLGISAGVGFIVAALQRLARMLGLALITAFFVMFRKSPA